MGTHGNAAQGDSGTVLGEPTVKQTPKRISAKQQGVHHGVTQSLIDRLSVGRLSEPRNSNLSVTGKDQTKKIKKASINESSLL